jgi:hypothetical protein
MHTMGRPVMKNSHEDRNLSYLRQLIIEKPMKHFIHDVHSIL